MQLRHPQPAFLNLSTGMEIIKNTNLKLSAPEVEIVSYCPSPGSWLEQQTQPQAPEEAITPVGPAGTSGQLFPRIVMKAHTREEP